MGPFKPSDFEKFCAAQGWRYEREANHGQLWGKPGATRPIVFTNRRELRLPVVKNCLKTMGLALQDFLAFLDRLG